MTRWPAPPWRRWILATIISIGDGVVAAAAPSIDVSVPPRRLDELQVHRLDGREVLVDDFIERPATLARIALDASNETDVGVGVDEHFDVAQLSYSRIGEQQNSVDAPTTSAGGTTGGLVAPGVADEVIDRLLDRLASCEPHELGDEELPIECVGVVPVDLSSFDQWQVRVIPVVRVHVDERNRFRVQRLRYVPRDGRLSGPRKPPAIPMIKGFITIAANRAMRR